MKDTAGPEYLRAEDLIRDGQWCEFDLTIKHEHAPGTLKAADGSLIDRPVIEFEKASKKLIVSKINERLLTYATGQQKGKWAGHRVRLRACSGTWFGQSNVAAIRVVIPQGRAKPFIKTKDYGTSLTGAVVNEEGGKNAKANG